MVQGDTLILRSGRSAASRRMRTTSSWFETCEGALLTVRASWSPRVMVRGETEGHDRAMLSADELERYARHIVLREVGGPGQAALKEASVLVIGAGGLGAPALMYLAAAGVGALGVVDDDIVSLSNLQRQIIHSPPDAGGSRVDPSAERIAALNPHVHFAAHATRLDARNAMELIGGYDLVLDGSDNLH